MATPNYNVNYEDERFSQVEADKQTAMSELEQTYSGLAADAEKVFQDQIDASQAWADEQTRLQNEQTDFAIEQIEQQKEQTHKDYIKEQSGAYVDWQKQSNEYGAEAEKMAAGGLDKTGYSESSQVSMYNTYQNRVATARETLAQVMLGYNNDINAARLQNSVALAEIASEAQKEQLALVLEGFQYKNSLILEQANKKVELENIYYNRWQDVLKQINTENAMAEEVRQFNENLSFQEEQKELDRQHQSEEAALERKFKEEQAKIERQHEKDMLAAETKAEKEKLEQQYQNQKKLLAEELANEKALLKYKNSLASTSSSSGGSGTVKKSSGSSGGSSKSSGSSGTVVKYDNKATGTVTNNMASILALGYGPISETKLAQLLSSGQVTRTKKNGQWYYSKNTASPNYNKLKNMGLSY